MGCGNSKEAPLLQLVLPDVHFPNDNSLYEAKDRISNTLNITGVSSVDIINFITAKVFSSDMSINGKPKQDLSVFNEIHQLFITKVIDHKERLPENYNFFGSNNSIENLELFIKHNPFMASALSKVDERLMIVSSPVNAVATASKGWFERIVDLLDNSYPRVDATFSDALKLEKIVVYNSSDGSVIEKSMHDAAGDLLQLLVYYFQVVHATIHVLHYIMASALKSTSKVYPMLESWVEPYITNVALKYLEVELALFKDGTVLTDGTYRTKTGDGGEVRKLAREMLCSWGSCSTADDFVQQMFSPSLIRQGEDGLKSSLAAYGIVSEFQKHVALIGDFAQELTASFELYDRAKYSQLNTKLAAFLSKCGTDLFKISSLRSWLELMSVTGTLHGCTLSMTRLVCCAEYRKRVNPKSDFYDSKDDSSLVVGMSTIIGMIEGRHVFTDKLDQPTVDCCFQVSPPFDPISNHVLQEFDAKASKLKKDYYDELMKDQVNFAEHGWILSDFCPDGIDGKQLTITTYI